LIIKANYYKPGKAGVINRQLTSKGKRKNGLEGNLQINFLAIIAKLGIQNFKPSHPAHIVVHKSNMISYYVSPLPIIRALYTTFNNNGSVQ
jgi:hypothetical protein